MNILYRIWNNWINHLLALQYLKIKVIFFSSIVISGKHITEKNKSQLYIASWLFITFYGTLKLIIRNKSLSTIFSKNFKIYSFFNTISIKTCTLGLLNLNGSTNKIYLSYWLKGYGYFHMWFLYFIGISTFIAQLDSLHRSKFDIICISN